MVDWFVKPKSKNGTGLNLTSQIRGIDCVAMNNDLGDVRIGTQGWNYDAWVDRSIHRRRDRPIF